MRAATSLSSPTRAIDRTRRSSAVRGQPPDDDDVEPLEPELPDEPELLLVEPEEPDEPDEPELLLVEPELPEEPELLLVEPELPEEPELLLVEPAFVSVGGSGRLHFAYSAAPGVQPPAQSKANVMPLQLHVPCPHTPLTESQLQVSVVGPELHVYSCALSHEKAPCPSPPLEELTFSKLQVEVDPEDDELLVGEPALSPCPAVADDEVLPERSSTTAFPPHAIAELRRVVPRKTRRRLRGDMVPSHQQHPDR